MPRIRVVTDSACDLPDALLKQLHITVVPLSLGWAGDSDADRAHLTADQLHRRLRAEASTPEVHPPTIEEFTHVYRSLRETCDGVLSLHVSSKLSDTLANAATAREAFGPVGQGGPFPISLVDSLSMSMGLGWIALAVARAAQQGSDLARLTNLATRLSGQSHVAFFNEQLDGLLKTGRVPRISSQLDSLAAMRPLFHLDEGQVVVYERTRTRAKARDALYNFVEDFPKIGEIAIMHTGSQTDLEHLLTRVGAIYPRERVLIVPPGPAVAAWLGPDALGVAVLEGEEV